MYIDNFNGTVSVLPYHRFVSVFFSLITGQYMLNFRVKPSLNTAVTEKKTDNVNTPDIIESQLAANAIVESIHFV